MNELSSLFFDEVEKLGRSGHRSRRGVEGRDIRKLKLQQRGRKWLPEFAEIYRLVELLSIELGQGL